MWIEGFIFAVHIQFADSKHMKMDYFGFLSKNSFNSRKKQKHQIKY